MFERRPTFTIIVASLALCLTSLAQAGAKGRTAGQDRLPAVSAPTHPSDQTASGPGSELLRLQRDLRDRLALTLRLMGFPVPPGSAGTLVIDGPDPMNSEGSGGGDGGDGGREGGEGGEGEGGSGESDPDGGSSQSKS